MLQQELTQSTKPVTFEDRAAKSLADFLGTDDDGPVEERPAAGANETFGEEQDPDPEFQDKKARHASYMRMSRSYESYLTGCRLSALIAIIARSRVSAYEHAGAVSKELKSLMKSSMPWQETTRARSKATCHNQFDVEIELYCVQLRNRYMMQCVSEPRPHQAAFGAVQGLGGVRGGLAPVEPDAKHLLRGENQTQ